MPIANRNASSRRRGRNAVYVLVGIAMQAGISAANAADLPPTLIPASGELPAPRLAGLFDLKLALPEGRGLAQLLLNAGIAQTDAAAAAKAAAGHLGDGSGGCDVKVSFSRSVEGSGFSLQRLVLTTGAGQTVIERRGGALTVVDGSKTAARSPLI